MHTRTFYKPKQKNIGNQNITLVSNDNQKFIVSKSTIVEHSQFFSVMLEEADVDDSNITIPVPKVDGTTLQMIVDFIQLDDMQLCSAVPKPFQRFDDYSSRWEQFNSVLFMCIFKKQNQKPIII